MMSEIVDHSHAARTAPHLLPPRDSFEARERGLDHLWHEAVEARRGRRHRRIADVKLTDERRIEPDFA